MDERTTLRYIDELQGQIDQLKKIIKGGGGGGSVVINPEGAATADLEKIKKGDTIYGLNYNKNSNRPQVNGNLLTGNKNSKQLNIAENMTEEEYAALSSKNENEIYFLQENASIVTETEDGYTITWEAYSDPAYVATLSYTPSDQDVTGITSVTCDTDTIEIVTFSLDHGDVSVTIGCEDPSEVPDNVEFTFTFTQPAGDTRIVKNGVEFGKVSGGSGYSETTLYIGTTDVASYELLQSIANFDAVAFKASYTTGQNTYLLSETIPASMMVADVGTGKSYGICSDDGYIYFSITDATHLAKTQNRSFFITDIIGIKY